MFDMIDCTHCDVPVKSRLKECEYVDRLSEKTYLLTTGLIMKLVEKFLNILSCMMTDFVEFFNQPSVTLLSGSKQVPSQFTVKEAIDMHLKDFQWFKLVQLQNCVDMMNNCQKLEPILNDIQSHIYSYIEQDRTKVLNDEQVDYEIDFKVDPMYKHFKMIDLHLMEECITTYYHREHGVSSLNIQYRVCKEYKSSFIGTHSIREDLYDNTRSDFVSTKQYLPMQDENGGRKCWQFDDRKIHI